MKHSILIILAFSIVLGGCIPKLGTTQVPGSSQVFLKGKIADGFPPLPLYPKAQVIESYSSQDKYGASFITGANLEKVVKFYGESLPKLGWETNLKRRSENEFVFEVKNDKNKGEVIVNAAADSKKTAITIWTEPR